MKQVAHPGHPQIDDLAFEIGVALVEPRRADVRCGPLGESESARTCSTRRPEVLPQATAFAARSSTVGMLITHSRVAFRSPNV